MATVFQKRRTRSQSAASKRPDLSSCATTSDEAPTGTIEQENNAAFAYSPERPRLPATQSRSASSEAPAARLRPLRLLRGGACDGTLANDCGQAAVAAIEVIAASRARGSSLRATRCAPSSLSGASA